MVANLSTRALEGSTSALEDVLYSGAPTGTSATTIVTASASGSGSSVEITSASACNTTGSTATLSLDICKAGDTAGVTHRVLSALSLAAGATSDLGTYLRGVRLGPGDFISVTQGTSAAVTVVITGIINS